MSWPLITDFSRMLQTPKIAFRDPALRDCAIEMDQFGQPKARSGNFATVYRAFRPDGSEFAVRVFNRRADNRRQRYQIISRFLEGRSLSSLVQFQYDEKGIRSASDGQLYPLVTMDWVAGITLFEWARDRSREGYVEALALGAEAWLQLVRELAAQSIVHGDLQHGNVLVSSEGYFKLVDYDGMCVPELLNQKNVETGLPPFQHPQRNADTLMFAGLDNFSALVIYVALRALAAAPHLWISYVDRPGYDKLLFRSSDFEQPHSSPLYHELCHSPDREVRDLTHYLFQLLSYEIHAVPPLDEVLLWCHSVDDFLAAHDWDKAIQLAQRLSEQEPLTDELRGQVADAYQRVAARQALEEAYNRGDEAEVQRRYLPELLDDYPAAGEIVALAREAGRVRELLETLKAQIRFGRWDLFSETWQTHQELLSQRPSARGLAREYQRVLAAETLRRLLKDKETYDQGVIDAWNFAQSLGGHPQADPFRDEVEKRARRLKEANRLRGLLEKAPDPPTIQYDKRLVSHWHTDLFDDSAQFATLRQQYQAARRRLDLLTRLSELTEQCTVESETTFETAGRELPEAYHPNLAKRVERAKNRLLAFRRLHDALNEPASDKAIVRAWSELGDVKAKGMANEQVRARVDLAKRRVAVLREIESIPAAEVLYRRDDRLLAVWNEPLLADCRDAKSFRAEWRAAVERAEAVGRLVASLEQGEPEAVTAAMADPRLQRFGLPEGARAKLNDWEAQRKRARLQRRDALIGTLRDGNRSHFVQQFDAELLREIAQQAPRHQAQIVQWTEEEILPLDKIGLRPGEPKSLEGLEANQYRAKWQWPSKTISTHCRLAVVKPPLRPRTHPDDAAPHFSLEIAEANRPSDAEGVPVTIDPTWGECQVVVWARIDLGFQVLWSEPLVLGETGASKKSRYGLFK